MKRAAALRLAVALTLSLPSLCLPPSLTLADDAPAEAAAPTATSAIAALHLHVVNVTRLENGLTVILEENHQSPFVAMHLRYDAGSRDDPPGLEGLAALTQRMALRGTKHVPAGGYARTLDRIGALDGGWNVLLDSTSEWVTVRTGAVDSVLWLWSDQMGFFAPDDPKSLLVAREEVAREREERVTRAPLGALTEIVYRALYPEGHPYHSVPIAELGDRATLDDIRTFHDKNLAPNDAVLILIGDFQSRAMLEKIRTYFAPLTAAPARGAAKLAPAQLEADIHLNVAANVPNAEVWMDWRTPPFFAAGDAELDIGARAMAGVRAAALRWTMVDQAHVATVVNAHQASHALGSDFRISATVAPGRRPSEVVAAIDVVLALLKTRGMSDRTSAGARANMIVPYVHALDRSARRASMYGSLAAAHRDPRALLADVGRYDAATTASVNATIAHWLTSAHRVVTIVTPDPTAPPGGVLRATRGVW